MIVFSLICRQLTWPDLLKQYQVRLLMLDARNSFIFRFTIWNNRRLQNEYTKQSVMGTTTHTHTHSRLTALCPGLPSTKKAKPIWILLKQETVSGSGISWAICKSAPRSRQITTPAPHHSDFYRPDALPAAQPTMSKH